MHTYDVITFLFKWRSLFYECGYEV